MALTFYTEGTVTGINVGDVKTLADITGPGVFVAILDMGFMDGNTFRFWWKAGFGNNPAVAATEVVVDSTLHASGLLTPPFPVFQSGQGMLELVSGTLTNGNVEYQIYKL